MELESNHATEILHNLNEDRKTTKDFCDFTIKAGGKQFPVHKCVVGSISEYFKKMFTTKMKESYSNEGSVKEVSGPTMASIINFIYTSCIIITHDNVYDVLEAAEYLRIPSLKEQCKRFFKASLNGENCLKIRSYSNRYNMGDLVQAAETFISKNLGAVLKSADFLQFGVDDVKAMLKLESDEESIDEDKYQSVINWTKHGVCDRKEHFSDLFCFIQLNYLSSEFLNDVVRKEELICNSLECANLLITSLTSRLCGAQVFKKGKGQFDEILIIGGTGCQQSVVKFNTNTNQWSKMPDTNIARRRPSAVNYNQQILLMGGGGSGAYYNSVEMLDLNDENPKWDSNLPSMEKKRYLFASTLLNGLVYCAGGWNGTGRFNDTCHLSSCESYNPEERKWSSIRNMNISRSHHALVSARGLLYALGGHDGNARTNTVECYDPRNGKWEYIPPMKTCRYGLTAVVLNNEIYAIGGYGLSSVEKYNLDTKAWIDVPSMNEKRNGGSACVVDGLIWVFGGKDAKTVEFYDPATNKWQVSTNMDRERQFPCVLSI